MRFYGQIRKFEWFGRKKYIIMTSEIDQTIRQQMKTRLSGLYKEAEKSLNIAVKFKPESEYYWTFYRQYKDTQKTILEIESHLGISR